MYCNATHPLHKEPLNRGLAKVNNEESGQEHLQHDSNLGQIQLLPLQVQNIYLFHF